MHARVVPWEAVAIATDIRMKWQDRATLSSGAAHSVFKPCDKGFS